MHPSMHQLAEHLTLLLLVLQYAKSGRAKCKAGKSCNDVIPQVRFCPGCWHCYAGKHLPALASASTWCRASCAWGQWQTLRTKGFQAQCGGTGEWLALMLPVMS